MTRQTRQQPKFKKGDKVRSCYDATNVGVIIDAGYKNGETIYFLDNGCVVYETEARAA